jgi:RNA polymerase sigma factor (sigma-70 family)
MNQLLKRALAGNEDAEKELFQHLFVRFRLFAKRKIGEVQDAEDIAQETCITVLEKYKSQSFTAGFESWVYGILRMKIGNFLQKKAVRKCVRLSKPDVIDMTGSMSNCCDHDLRRRISDCAKKIICSYPRYARVLNLIHQGFRIDEISRRLAITPNNIYVILNRGRSILKSCLKTGGV